ncbi:stage II sporulation protein D [Mesobacillus persicus]|uniref:Stage II sporulation protein D n=1 Tax=Mesobacillus persicus TaxID=930146 RepID=A0A1H8H3R6_9BACI|nr:stage II sporulation protein D [Mesobacillus persicus]SEN50765.1 stage II sporulation protein D [Mesobacillus persicus]
MKKSFNPIIVLAALLFTVILLIPTVLVLPFSGEKASGQLSENVTPADPNAEPSADSAVEVAVFRTAQSEVERVPLNEYLVGVVAAEMPAEFELEALKAQALTARTYYVKQMMGTGTTGLPDGAHVTDTTAHQVYKNTAELKQQWKSEFNEKYAKVREAVQATDGQILTYGGEPIEATFFSTSNGFTENSEEYWANNIPYLRSVESPWDKVSPKYTEQKIIPVSEFEKKLGVKLTDRSEVGKITQKTEGNRVGKVEIAGKVLSGRDVRDMLGLNSSDFKWYAKGDNIVIETKGYGHGVGMSQYGANGMAAEGKSYKEIVQHYYKGIEIASGENTLTQVMAKK